MKIAIIGAGGVGGYLGAKLIKSSMSEVKIFVKEKQRKVIEKNGLKIIDGDEKFVVKPDLSPPFEGEIFDAVFIGVKSYDLKSACEEINRYVNERSLIVPLLNGVAHKERIRRYLPKAVVCHGCVYVVSHQKSEGVIVNKSSLFYLIFGDKKITSKMRELEELLKKSYLKCKLSETAHYECWKKYLFISTFATMTSYFDEPMDLIYKKYPDILYEVLHEVKRVANVLEVPINESDIQKVIKQAENLTSNSKTSMQLDFEKGRKTELDSLCGYIVKAAKERNIEINRMQKMYEALKKRI